MFNEANRHDGTSLIVTKSLCIRDEDFASFTVHMTHNAVLNKFYNCKMNDFDLFIVGLISSAWGFVSVTARLNRKTKTKVKTVPRASFFYWLHSKPVCDRICERVKLFCRTSYS